MVEKLADRMTGRERERERGSGHRGYQDRVNGVPTHVEVQLVSLYNFFTRTSFNFQNCFPFYSLIIFYDVYLYLFYSNIMQAKFLLPDR